jgi:hypothetical protein
MGSSILVGGHSGPAGCWRSYAADRETVSLVGRLERRLEMVEQIVRLNRSAMTGREHQIAIDPAIAKHFPLSILVQLMLQQCCSQRVRERQQAPARLRLRRIAMELAAVAVHRAGDGEHWSAPVPNVPNRVAWAGGWYSMDRGSPAPQRTLLFRMSSRRFVERSVRFGNRSVSHSL